MAGVSGTICLCSHPPSNREAVPDSIWGQREVEESAYSRSFSMTGHRKGGAWPLWGRL